MRWPTHPLNPGWGVRGRSVGRSAFRLFFVAVGCNAVTVIAWDRNLLDGSPLWVSIGLLGVLGTALAGFAAWVVGEFVAVDRELRSRSS